jgi:hypothetical protein
LTAVVLLPTPPFARGHGDDVAHPRQRREAALHGVRRDALRDRDPGAQRLAQFGRDARVQAACRVAQLDVDLQLAADLGDAPHLLGGVPTQSGDRVLQAVQQVQGGGLTGTAHRGDSIRGRQCRFDGNHTLRQRKLTY